jgi:hypothetical protein
MIANPLKIRDLISEQSRGGIKIPEIQAQFVPMDRELWKLDRFADFLSARRKLLAQAMNEVLSG